MRKSTSSSGAMMPISAWVGSAPIKKVGKAMHRIETIST